MSKRHHSNSSENKKQQLLTAPRWSQLAFSSVSTSIFFASLLVIAILVLLFGRPVPAESMRGLPVSFGKEQTVHILPSAASSTGWSNEYAVLVQDLNDRSLLQMFDSGNSAYFGSEVKSPHIPQAPIPPTSTPKLNPNRPTTTSAQQSVGAPGASSTAQVDTPSNVDDVVEQNVEPVSESTPEPTSEPEFEPVPDPILETAPEPEPVTNEPSAIRWGVFEQAALYPLAQLTIISSTTDVVEQSEPESVPEPDSTPEPVPEPAPPVVVASTTAAEESVVELDESSLVSTTSFQDTPTESVDDAATSTPVTAIAFDDSMPEIVMTGFDVGQLDPGQLVNGAQLRLSFAGSLKRPVPLGEASPYVEIQFITASGTQTVGSILLDDEASNAINGGYYLFGLPTDITLKELSTASVVVRYHGDVKAVAALYVDAAWIEVNTRLITKEDLLARGIANQLEHLPKPERAQLLSDKVNFTRTETPLFNLSYTPQRNALVRGLRSLAGADVVAVDKVEVRHVTLGPINITPTVNVTHDGLITIELPDDAKQHLQPGEYQIVLTLSEGGVEYTDSFDFQWGILTINPNKSEYEVGETAELSIGALTQNGNTICHANLDLYITDPLDVVTRVPVTESGFCDGNNVIDVPDFMAQTLVTEPGEYELYLERLDDSGQVLGFTTDTFLATIDQTLSIERTGPTRIFPPAPYIMTMTVASEDGFSGTLTEKAPASFAIFNTNATVSRKGDEQVLTWDVDIPAGGSVDISYQFDAPDISPYLFNLGPAHLIGDTGIQNASSSSKTVFTEHRQWQIASDAVGNMLLFWDNGASVPSGWTCVSCTGGDPFFQRFIMGSSTYNSTGGAATHTHTAAGSVLATSANTTESGSGTAAPASHTHTYTPTIGSASNLPEYRQLRVIQYTTSAGEPATIPAGAIGVFDVASSSLPTNWNRYSAQDGRYVRGENTPASTGGSNVHTHSISGSTGAASGAGSRTRGGTANGSSLTHTHTVTGTTGSVSNEPPYISVLFAKLTTDSAPPNGLIAMWTEDVGGGWIDISSAPGDPFNQRFMKPATTYGSTGGSVTNTHSDVTGLTSGVPSATANALTGGTSGSSNTHTHTVNVTGFSTSSHLPPYVTAVFGKRQGTDPVYNQLAYQWFANSTSLTPTEPWPDDAGAIDLDENEPISATSTPVKDGDLVRLRVNAQVTNATSTAGNAFKLQFATTSVCSAASTWSDVGDESSNVVWRGHDVSGISDAATIPTTILGSSTVAESYEEDAQASSTPNEIPLGDTGEWDFVLEHNGAAAGTEYCFRLVEGDGSAFFAYTSYPKLLTNAAPATVLQTPFDNEKTASTTPRFYFVATDSEGNTVDYQIQVDDDPTFGSPLIDKDTISNSSQFENQVLISDKAPFRQGEQIEFTPSVSLTNGVTYYWRVRASDPEGSNSWGSWSATSSVTVDTSLTATAWFQTENEQFETNTLVGVQATGDSLSLITGSTTGSVTTGAITFTAGTRGTAWDSFSFNDTETSGDIKYTLQYYDGSTWANIPNGDLAGNSSGFDTSPVSLLGLDVDTYNTIRIVATFTNSGGSPSLQDWTVSWGYRVETPTITKLFPNEQTGTTTPTFEFSTNDPQADDLTYQISWSTTPDFAASTTRTSDAGGTTGFVNVDTGADTDPFNSGDTIRFTIQPADALTGTTTYWWRVRAKDTTGDNAYSFWTEPQSFTVIPGTDVSTWFQTTGDQFDTNTLSGTISFLNTVTVATTAVEALAVYGEGTVTTPRYRIWNGSTWGAEGSMSDIGAPIRWAVAQAATTREEYVAVTVGTDADVNVQVYSTGVWSHLQELTTSVSDITARGVDIAYETLSGRAIVVYCDGDADPGYYIWNGSSWAAGTSTINLSSADNCAWVELEADPTSNEIILLSRDTTGNTYEAQVWNGSTWGNATTLGSVTESDHAGMALMYEESGNQAIIVSSDGNPARFRWNTWNGSTWGTAQTQTIGDDFEWGHMARDVGSDEIILCYQDEDSDVGVVRWTGSAWAGQTELSQDAFAKNEPSFACVFEDGGSRDNFILTTFAENVAGQTQYSSWNNTSWATAAQVSTLGSIPSMQLIRTDVGSVLGFFFDSSADSIYFSDWSGSTWSSVSTIESNASVDTAQYGQPYYLTPRNPGSDGTAIVSPPIYFSDGSGPYWQSFSWNDTQPGTSQILYHLQYQNGSGNWAFIPDTDLPGNVAGTTTGPFDLTNLNRFTYNTIRPYAELSCDGSGNCPQLQDWKVEWAGGITVSGTAQQYDQSSNVTSGTVAVAVNGVLQTGKTGVISAGAWSISNVTVFPGDIVTVFINGAADANEAVGVTRYDGVGNIDGVSLYERHVSLGSNDATSTALTNVDIGQYDVLNDEDVFMSVSTTTLQVCGTTGCFDAELFVKTGTNYTPGGDIVSHDFENNGTFTLGAHTLTLTGSWDNNATTSLTNSTVVMSATSTNETVDNTGAAATSFNNLTFGTAASSANWSLPTPLDVNGDLTVNFGTLARGSTAITVAGDVTTGANGLWTGVGTTTFDGNTTATWSDAHTVGTLQNIGAVVIDGTNKAVILAGNVAAESITIGVDDTLDASASNYDIYVYGDWRNQNNFLARNGEVVFAATTSGQVITTSGDSFYDLTFNGSGGTWAFTESTLSVANNLTVAAGTVTLPTATTTIDGSFNATGGNFAHNNGTLLFTSDTTETITLAGGAFTNVLNNVYFNGAGTWTMTDSVATSTSDFVIQQGTVVLPSSTLAIGGSFSNTGGFFTAGTGEVRFYSSGSETITVGSSSFTDLTIAGTGSWTMTDTNVTATGDVVVEQGTLTLPSGTFTVGGSLNNSATLVAGTGTVLFNSSTLGETVTVGSATLHNVVFDNASGGWTIFGSATTTGNFDLATASLFTLQSGATLSVTGSFTNTVGGAATTWTGTTLSLEAGSYSVNGKLDAGDDYNVVRVASGAHIAWWNSAAASYVIAAGGSLYSQDHNGIDGGLYIFGDYSNSSGSEYWSYATDFDGTALTASTSRQANVHFASGATAALSSTTIEIIGDSAASTTIANQGSGTYTIDITDGSISAQYYEFADLGATGVSFSGAPTIVSLDNGLYTVAAAAGSAMTVSSSTIDANPAMQFFGVAFATTTAISAANVTQTGGAPASYWWFRNGYGNLYGENFDNDTGNPGSVRFDDSSLVLTISGTVYTDDGITALTGGTCNDSSPSVRVVVGGELPGYTGSCSSADGSYSIGGVIVTGDQTLTIFLDNAAGAEEGSIVLRTPTADVTNADIYQNRVIVRNEDVQASTIANLAIYDGSNDDDLNFIAATSTNPDTLTVEAGNELYLWASSTFTPGGVVTLQADAQANGYDGTLYIADSATFNAYSTSTVTIGGRLVLGASSTLNAVSSVVLMTATTTGKSITASDSITFNDLIFNGSGGAWNLGADIIVNGDMTITNGTVIGTGDITVPTGSVSGNGVLSLGGGTTTIGRSNTLGGTTAWTFYNLQLGDGLVAGTTTPLFTSTTTIGGRLTIATAHFLDANSTTWDLAGSGVVFVENGTLLEDTSTLRYSGPGSVVAATQYYNLDINAGAGSQTYVAGGIGTIVDGNLTVGGQSTSLFDINANDVVFDVNGDVLIKSNGTLSTSNNASFTIAGDYDNNGSLTHNGGTIIFDGTGTQTVAAGSSSFGNVVVDASGTVAFTESATTSANFDLLSASAFTLNSGQSLASGGQFFNALGGAATTWTGSTLALFGGQDYSINAATSSDSYATLYVAPSTQIRMWNSDASTYTISNTGSLYSQDHANVDGDLYIWGAYTKTNATDYWSYARDFDGTVLSGGSRRKVDVSFAPSASVKITGGFLDVTGAATASTTIDRQSTGSYGVTIGGTASTTMKYYQVRNTNSSGLIFTGTPTVKNLSFGDFELAQTGGSAITVGGTVITANPAKTFTLNRFALGAAASGFNVTATGTSVSSWRFTNHYGDIDGESFDVDPDGDPGYIVWDDSAANITISGTVYTDEGVTNAGTCGGATPAVRVVVAGLTTYNSNCTAGVFTVSGVTYSPGDSIVAYLLPATGIEGATVTVDPVSNINNFDIYQNRVIVRHENTDPITIADMAVYDSSDDGNIPFTAVDASPDTLTLPADRKLIVWNGKTFAPAGNVTLTNGGSLAYGGSLQLQSGATWQGAGTGALTVGGNLTLDTGASFNTSNGTTTFTATGARTIDVNEDSFHHIAFTGSGSWTITDPTFTVAGDFRQTAGTLTLPSGTSTFDGSFTSTGGSFDANSGTAHFTGGNTHSVTLSGSDLATAIFAGGTYSMLDTNATTTGSVTIESGTLVLPSGSLAVGSDFTNESANITHNTAELRMTSTTTATVTTAGSDLYGLIFTGGGTYLMGDIDSSLLDSFIIQSGDVTLGTGTLAIGGSFDAAGGTFTHSSGTVLFNSSDSGETIDPGASPFYNVQIGAPTGGYTVTANATTSNNFTLASAANFTVQSGVTLTVNGVFSNAVGGSATTWNGSTLTLNGGNAYTINSKTVTDKYDTLTIGEDTDLRMWNSAATTTIVASSSSLYSQDHLNVAGVLYIYGDFHIGTTTEYWSYATDFDGTNLSGGSERTVQVGIQNNATTTVDGGTLHIVGVSGSRTQVSNQGSGTYGLAVSDGTLNASYYQMRNLNAAGLTLTGTPSITSLAYGDYELAVSAGTLITLASSTLNANASLIIPGARFATTTAITGTNVTLVGSTPSVWTFTTHTGNLAGENFDSDGATACGQIRWSNSACQLVEQTAYRWRNDDGGLEVPDAEWFNVNWAARQRLRIENNDSTPYTDAVVRVLVPYDADMQSDFDDLRFTSGDGVTAVDFWIGSTTVSTLAEAWVTVPTLPAEDQATLFMYYNNPSAAASSSLNNTFIAGDDFEDGNISEYSGQTSEFNVDASFAYGDSNGLEASSVTGRTNTGGIYDLSNSVSNNNETIRFTQYVNPSFNDETCFKFGIQASSPPSQNYGLCLDLNGTDQLALVKNAVDSVGTTPASTLDITNITVTAGWYTFEIDWSSGGVSAVMTSAAGSTIGTVSSTDTSYSSGGIGFTYWFQHGGWDNVFSRPTLTTEPTYRFGVEQAAGGATWNAAENTRGEYDLTETARVRFAIENSGLPITSQQFRLEYAPLGSAPRCEAVNAATFSTVPPQSSCGSSPVCMEASAQVTNGAATVDLLTDVSGGFTPGQLREDPSNTTSNIDVDTDEYTELEYVVTTTNNVVDENLCFRVTNAGTDYDTYLAVAELRLKFDPVLGTPTLNDGQSISLLPGTTTRVYATTTVNDFNGPSDIASATTTFYRGTTTALCTPNHNNCYVASTNAATCSLQNCSGNTCDLICYADMYFHADPTDSGSIFDGQEWFAFMEVEDQSAGYDFDTSIGQELLTLRAIDVNNAIDYGALAVNTNTGSYNASTTITNEGNVEADIEVLGTDLTDGFSSTIPSNLQKFATSTFTYNTCGASCEILSSTTPVTLDIDLNKPTTDSPPVSDAVYWGIAIPIGVHSTPHSGLNVFTPVSP